MQKRSSSFEKERYNSRPNASKHMPCLQQNLQLVQPHQSHLFGSRTWCKEASWAANFVQQKEGCAALQLSLRSCQDSLLVRWLDWLHGIGNILSHPHCGTAPPHTLMRPHCCTNGRPVHFAAHSHFSSTPPASLSFLLC